ncbi:uncharacterized [Tachysurus ichikawai]
MVTEDLCSRALEIKGVTETRDLASGTQAGLGFGRDVGLRRLPLPSTDFGPVLAGSLPLIQIPVFVPGLPSVEDACAPVKRRPDQEPSQE